ncbi:hypothetical protein ARMGADRAFT_750517 [Armillaria gallica]|uniref:Uncharacterized protein n=1 Tax=Armillaria gallica TaxID=47427 RepID=A0A2H3DKU8_ARMGA|nr:hypothetical protein ARMGADRAFT_750517 [Armillaria gallica]
MYHPELRLGMMHSHCHRTNVDSPGSGCLARARYLAGAATLALNLSDFPFTRQRPPTALGHLQRHLVTLLRRSSHPQTSLSCSIEPASYGVCLGELASEEQLPLLSAQSRCKATYNASAFDMSSFPYSLWRHLSQHHRTLYPSRLNARTNKHVHQTILCATHFSICLLVNKLVTEPQHACLATPFDLHLSSMVPATLQRVVTPYRTLPSPSLTNASPLGRPSSPEEDLRARLLLPSSLATTYRVACCTWGTRPRLASIRTRKRSKVPSLLFNLSRRKS